MSLLMIFLSRYLVGGSGGGDALEHGRSCPFPPPGQQKDLYHGFPAAEHMLLD